MNKIARFAAALALAAGLGATGALAEEDEFKAVLGETETAYEAGDTAKVKQNLEYLLQLVAQMRLGSLVDFLPAPLEGWTAGDDNAAAMGAAMFGGGVSAGRTYSKSGSEVELQIVGDSPMLAQMSMVFSNPMLMSQGGMRAIRINGQTAMVQDGDVTLMVDNRWMITAQGSAAEADKVAYLSAIDTEALAAFE